MTPTPPMSELQKLGQEFEVRQMIDDLRLHAFDDCGETDVPTHIANLAADMLHRLAFQQPGGEDQALLDDANAWYSEEQWNEINRYASHARSCLSRKGAQYDEGDCDCGYKRIATCAPTIEPAPDAALRSALEWYGEQARLARLITSEGDLGRWALDADGGKRARDILTATPSHKEDR